MSEQFSATVRQFLAPVLSFLDDPDVSEIMINAPDEIWVERGGKVEKIDAKFESKDALMSAVNNIGQFSNRRISEENPRMDARLPDGSRIHVLLPPCARKGICISIRKFSKDPLTVDKLLEFGSLTQDTVDFIKACTLLKKNIMISGGTGTGKTSLLNVLSSLIPNDERIIVIEDSAELQLQQDHLLLLETRVPDRQGKGEVSIRDLLHSTLRLRPDRIVIGEIRGGEALDLLQAMNTGHGGTMGTIHANDPFGALNRLETLTLFSGIELPLKAIRSQVASAIQVVIQASRFHDGSRKVSHISEVLPLGEDGNYRVSDIFLFKQKGTGDKGQVIGSLEPTGAVPSFIEEIKDSGHKISSKLFG